jgi:hypothetical protein
MGTSPRKPYMQKSTGIQSSGMHKNEFKELENTQQ